MSAHIKTWQEEAGERGLTANEAADCMIREVTELRATITRYEAQMLRMAQCAGEFAKDAAPLPQQAAVCPVCKGNDADMPCAYPSEGLRGCLRDARLVQQAAGEERGDSWITAKVARHLDLAFRNGVSAGWNAGVEGNGETLQRLKSQVGTRAEYSALFPESAQQAIQVDKPVAQVVRDADGCDDVRWLVDSASGDVQPGDLLYKK